MTLTPEQINDLVGVDAKYKKEFERHVKSIFPGVGLHRVFIDGKWQYGAETVEAMYRLYYRGRQDEFMSTLNKLSGNPQA